MLDLSGVDTVTIARDGKKNVETRITAIAENYVLHYIFLSPSAYRALYGEEPPYNSLYVNYEEKTPREESDMGAFLMGLKGCTGVRFTTDLEKSIEDMLSILGNIVLVLIVSAGLLAFVVLYNLNSINIMERRRELATLKVLGFFDTEVAAYVYRENVLLTIFGILAGIVFGTVLHHFTIVTVEVDLMMFGRSIRPVSYVYSTLITFGFALLVNGAMYFSLKKVDMIESLKSVE
jgi:putative ABC transport system permease protein